jgi:predicted Zn-dependent protease with MMP-like domain
MATEPLFREEDIEGYTASELDAINAEWAAIVHIANRVRPQHVPYPAIVQAVHDARRQTDQPTEQRALELLHERGHMAGLSDDQQHEVKWDVKAEVAYRAYRADRA